jgi:hypothetical protein
MGVGFYKDYGGEKKEDTHTGMTCTPFELHAEGLPDTERKVFDGKQTTEDISMQEFPSGIEVELESDKDQAASAGSETQLARRLTYMTPVEHLIGDSPNQCIIEVAELLDKKDGLDCVQLWQELLHKSPNEEAVHQQTEGPTMFLLKLWCQIKRSAATVGELIRALDAVNRPDISTLIQTYCQVRSYLSRWKEKKSFYFCILYLDTSILMHVSVLLLPTSSLRYQSR